MKTRASKALAFGVALIMAALAMNSAFADGAQKFKIRIAGGFIQTHRLCPAGIGRRLPARW